MDVICDEGLYNKLFICSTLEYITIVVNLHTHSLSFSPFLSLSLPFSPFLSLSLSLFLSLSLPFSLSLSLFLSFSLFLYLSLSFPFFISPSLSFSVGQILLTNIVSRTTLEHESRMLSILK